MRLLTTGALGLAALAVAAVARRGRTSDTLASPGARVDTGPLVTWLVRVPANTPANAAIAISGNIAELGTWNAAGIRLLQVEPQLYRASAHVPRGAALEYKVTRGGWNSVETCRDGSERTNRRLRVNHDEKVTVDIEAWSDLT